MMVSVLENEHPDKYWYRSKPQNRRDVKNGLRRYCDVVVKREAYVNTKVLTFQNGCKTNWQIVRQKLKEGLTKRILHKLTSCE